MNTGLLGFFQQDPDKQEALRQGLLNAGIAMMAGGRQDLGTAVGQGMGAGVGIYRQQIEDLKRRQAQMADINAARGPRPQMPQMPKPGMQAPNMGMPQPAQPAMGQPAPTAMGAPAPMGQPAPAAPVSNEAPGPMAAAAPVASPEQEQAQQMDMLRYLNFAAQNPDNPDRELALGALAKSASGDQKTTTEMANWQFADSLPEPQRSQFKAMLAKASGGTTPAAIQEYEYLNSLDEAGRKLYFENKRAAQTMNLGNVMAVRAPGGGIGETYAINPKLTETPSYQAAQAAAVEGAKNAAKFGVEQQAADVKLSADFADISRLAEEAKKHLAVASSGKAQALLAAGKGVVGISDEATKANARLKIISGQLTAKQPRFEGPQSDSDKADYKAMAGDVSNPDIPVEDRMAALETMLQMHKKYGTQPPSAAPKPAAQRPVQAPNKAQATGTFKSPYTVTNDDDFNRVPKGKYFKAPDGSIRVKP